MCPFLFVPPAQASVGGRPALLRAFSAPTSSRMPQAGSPAMPKPSSRHGSWQIPRALDQQADPVAASTFALPIPPQARRTSADTIFISPPIRRNLGAA